MRVRRVRLRARDGLYLGAIALLTDRPASPPLVAVASRQAARLAAAVAWPRSSCIPASELAIALVQSLRRPPRAAAPAAAPRLPGRRARRARGRWSIVPDAPRRASSGVRRAGRAPRGAGAREPRSACSLRDPHRLRGRAAARRMPGDAAILDAAARRHRRAQRAPRRRTRRPLLPLPPRAALERRARACWMGWERKRGKIEEFNRLLRGATDTSFVAAAAATSRSCPTSATASRSTATPGCRATPRAS